MHTPIYKNVDVLDKSYGGQWRRYLWGIGARSPSNFGNSMHTTAAANLTVQILKINKEKHVLNFHLSRQKHANTHVNRLKQPLNQKEIPGRGGEEKVHAVPPSPHILATPLTLATVALVLSPPHHRLDNARSRGLAGDLQHSSGPSEIRS